MVDAIVDVAILGVRITSNPQRFAVNEIRETYFMSIGCWRPWSSYNIRPSPNWAVQRHRNQPANFYLNLPVRRKDPPQRLH